MIFSWFDSIDNKTAFLMDSSVPTALAHACKYVTDVGLAHRAIYNSINGSIMPESIEALKNSDVDAAIVLAFNPADPSVAGREKVLTSGGVAGQTKGMLEIAEYAVSSARSSILQQPPLVSVPAAFTVRSLRARQSTATRPVVHTTT